MIALDNQATAFYYTQFLSEGIMTQLLYQTDSYIQAFSAKIVDLDQENHAFVWIKPLLPGGGGQPYDTGIIQLKAIPLSHKKSRKIGDEVFHFMKVTIQYQRLKNRLKVK